MALRVAPSSIRDISRTLNNSDIVFGEQKRIDAQAAQQSCDSLIKHFESAFTHLGEFSNQIEICRSPLQNALEVIPDDPKLFRLFQIKLLKQAIEFEEEYQLFVGISLQATVYTEGLQQQIDQLIPKSRVYLNEELVKKNKPDLWASMNETDATCQTSILALRSCFATMRTAETKIKDQLNNVVGWNLQGFCQIAMNGGQYIGKISRFWNACATATIPSREDLQAKLQPLLDEVVKEETQPEVKKDAEDPLDLNVAVLGNVEWGVFSGGETQPEFKEDALDHLDHPLAAALLETVEENVSPKEETQLEAQAV